MNLKSDNSNRTTLYDGNKRVMQSRQDNKESLST